MNILVTGAAGFIGFHLCKKLHELNYEVIGYDNFNNFYDLDLKLNRAKILKEKFNIQIIKGDIQNKEKIEEILNENNISHVFHLAALAGVLPSIKYPFEYVQTNINGFLSILESCKNFKDLKLIFASSSSIYGMTEDIPFVETNKTNKPTSLYGATKKADELIAYTYSNIYDMKIIGLRFFTVYGPWGRPDMAYYKFTKKISNNEPIDIYNFGKMQRDFTYIDDIIDGVVSVLNKDFENFEVFNLGNNNPIKLMNLVEIIENNLNKKAKINFLPFQKGEVIKTYADINKANKFLNFYPKTSFEKGMKKFISWYKNYHLST